jgi:hypothetical protein
MIYVESLWVRGDPTGDSYPYEYEYGVNPYPQVNISDPMRLFFCSGYEYEIIIPCGHLLY